MDEKLIDEPEAKSGSKKFILIVVLLLVLLGGGGVAAYMSGMLETDDAHDEPEKVEAPPPPVDTVFYHLPTMLANLAGERGRPRFLKFTVALEPNGRSANYGVRLEERAREGRTNYVVP